MYNCINIARIDLKRVFNCGKRHNAFSMAEMLVVMLILAIVIISMTPVAVKRVKKESVNPEHGSFECFYEPSGEAGKYNLIQRERNAQGVLLQPEDDPARIRGVYDVNNPPSNLPTCKFTAPRGAMFFTVNAVGGGSPGAGSKTVFQQLPKWDQNSINVKPGVNYINTYPEYKSVLIDTSKNNTAYFEGATFGSLSESNTPVNVLNNKGLLVYAYMLSAGGILDESTQAGYAIQTINDSGCGTNPDFTKMSYTANGSYGHWYNTVKVCKKYTFGICTGGWKNVECLVVDVYPGQNPGSGSAQKLSTTVKNGTNITSNGGADGVAIFGAGTTGCKVGVGQNGCYNSNCSPQHGAVAALDGMTCSSTSSYRALGSGYPSEYSTITSSTMTSGTNMNSVHFIPSDDCRPSGGQFIAPSGDACPTMINNKEYKVVWTIKENKDGSRWYLYTMGNFALIKRVLSKGVNFYAQAGNPGEFRTLYVSRFTQTVNITPGPPKPASANSNSDTGNRTIMTYADGTPLLSVAGGKRAIASGEAEGNTFIVGNLFNLPKPGSPLVIAYDNNTGDSSGSPNEYGGYFRAQNSGFIYPVPDVQNVIPDTVGQGGHGSYTIFRSSGHTEGYRVWRVNADKTNGYEELLNNITTSGAQITPAAYNCVSNGKTLSGNITTNNDTTNSYRCYAGDGQGGAVVITW